MAIKASSRFIIALIFFSIATWLTINIKPVTCNLHREITSEKEKILWICLRVYFLQIIFGCFVTIFQAHLEIACFSNRLCPGESLWRK